MEYALLIIIPLSIAVIALLSYIIFWERSRRDDK
jgi:hypothetical protein